jgi:hypothetical protein
MTPYVLFCNLIGLITHSIAYWQTGKRRKFLIRAGPRDKMSR